MGNKDENYDSLAWMKDFNSKMLKVSIQMGQKPDFLTKFNKMINKPSDILREKSQKDPGARGAR